MPLETKPQGPPRPSVPSCLRDPAPGFCADDLATHVAAHGAFLARGDADLARGACLLAAVAALRIAASRSASAFAHEVRVRRLRAALAGFDPVQRAHLAELMEAALSRDAAERLAAGLAPHGRRLRGWLTGGQPGEGAPTDAAGTIDPHRAPPPDAIARYAEATATGDVDVALCSAIDLLGEIVGRVRRGEGVEVAFDALERAALALCVRPAADRAERDDARRTLVILMLTLRRRRPLVAVMLRQRLVLDRRRWGGARSEGGGARPP